VKAKSTELHGITWDHSRALPPLVATAQRFEELNPGIRIQWHKRSLHEFGHMNVEQLARQFDLVVMDHPWMGFAAARGIFVNLPDHFEPAYFEKLKLATVSHCAESYNYSEQWLAVPIDAASPAASYRPDLLASADVPRSWDQLLELAAGGRVILPAFHVDLLLHLVMLAATLADQPLFAADDVWCDGAVLDHALDLLQALMAHIPVRCFDMNPIAVYETLSHRQDFAYCPFAYTYNNYARLDFSQERLKFADPVQMPARGMLRGVLGGTGLAVSTRCPALKPALQYLRFTADSAVQRTIYTHAGGQPAARDAWDEPTNNSLTNDFFKGTRASIECAYVRPRYDGFIEFQEHAGEPLVAWLRGETTRQTAVDRMNAIYRRSRQAAPRHRDDQAIVSGAS
jgi:multiple sugar transport system substrate-binding protein